MAPASTQVHSPVFEHSSRVKPKPNTKYFDFQFLFSVVLQVLFCLNIYNLCRHKKDCDFLSRLHQAAALLWVPGPLLLPVLPRERAGGRSWQSAEEVGLQQVLRQQLRPWSAEQDCGRPTVQPERHQQWFVQEGQRSGGRQGELREHQLHNLYDKNVIFLCESHSMMA